MSTLQIKRGATAAVGAYVPLQGEFVLDTSTYKLYIGDGTTAGGRAISGSSSGPATADQLTTARTFSINGAATAAAISFNGTADVALNVTSLDATKLTGTAAISTTGSAAKLTTSRTIALAGSVVGTAKFDGSANISINTVLGDLDLGTL